MSELSKQYDPKAHEKDIYKRWEESGAFQPSEQVLKAGKSPFVITLPPPNITGSLHMGHALNGTIQDALIRYHRMLGEPALWIPGTDHAGIATQNVVEKELRKEGKTRHDLGREKFLERVWQWRETYGNTIIHQLKSIGASCDWSRTAFTMDPKYVKAVQETFVTYFERGYIYRGNRIVNWCPRCASVISDLEIKRAERDGMLYTLRYPLVEGGYIEVATTRPETMLGDTAVAVHPDDERYKEVVGKTVMLPIMDRRIPVVADERVDQTYGTGAVKITPAHDPLDAEIGETHKLAAINVIGEDGTMTDRAGSFAGLPVEEARQKVIERLRSEGVLIHEETHRHNLTLCDRCGTAIEPLVSRQWFVDMSKLKNETIDVVEKDLVRFHPGRWKKHLLTWMENVRDWTISRQLWWGHSIPVWWKPGSRNTEYEEGSYVVSIEKPAGDWEQDPDVLDTWFSSALWPFATLGWPEQTADLKNFYPTSVLSTARDILYLWVARMIFSGLELVKKEESEKIDQAQRIPFRDVLVHPTVLNKQGQRMSKSLGTGVDPLELIDKYGADATRFGLMYQMSYDNQAIKFNETAVESARNFANKLWNLARLLDSLPEKNEATVADRWIEGECHACANVVTKYLNDFKLGEAAREIYNFVWKEYADWYMEILKVQGSKKVAREVFLTVLKLSHPFIPHITEVLWEHFNQEGMLITASWPSSEVVEKSEAKQQMNQFQEVVNTIRSARKLFDIPPSATIKICIENPVLIDALIKLARVELLDKPLEGMIRLPLANGQSVALMSEYITEDSIEQGRNKLSREAHDLETLISKTEQMLKAMRDKAPAEVVAEKEEMLSNAKKRLEEVKQSQALLA